MRAFMVFTLVLTASVCMAERPVARARTPAKEFEGAVDYDQ